MFGMPYIDLLEFIQGIFNAAHEAPPLAPESAEVPHADPEAELQQRERLRTIHTFILEQVRDRCERRPWQRRLSVHFPEMEEIYSQIADNILSNDLELSADTDTDATTLREWLQEIEKNKRLLQPIIRRQFTDSRSSVESYGTLKDGNREVG